MTSSWRSAAGIGRCSICRRGASRRPRTRKARRMTSSSAPIGPLPPAWSSMWRLCKLGYRNEPGLMLWAFVLSLLAALPDALLAVWLKLLGDGLLEHRSGLLRAAAAGLAVTAPATWFLRTVSTRVQRTF